MSDVEMIVGAATFVAALVGAYVASWCDGRRTLRYMDQLAAEAREALAAQHRGDRA